MSERNGRADAGRNGVATLTVQAFHTEHRPTWCPGCGDYGILTALKKAFAELGLAPHQVMIISGIGCGSKITDYINANGFMTIHGRALAVATGFRLANPAMPTIVVTGDGDGYGIGGNHLLHTLRRNINLTHIVENNQIYALTKGQYSPTSEQGFVTPTSPDGAPERPILPTALAFVGGATWIGRGSAGRPQQLAELIVDAIRHPGYALLDVLQPCVTFNKLNTYDWYDERSRDVTELAGADYDPSDREQAWAMVQRWGDEGIPLGVLYREHLPTYEDGVVAYKRHRPPIAFMEQPLSAEQFDALKAELL